MLSLFLYYYNKLCVILYDTNEEFVIIAAPSKMESLRILISIHCSNAGNCVSRQDTNKRFLLWLPPSASLQLALPHELALCLYVFVLVG